MAAQRTQADSPRECLGWPRLERDLVNVETTFFIARGREGEGREGTEAGGRGDGLYGEHALGRANEITLRPEESTAHWGATRFRSPFQGGGTDARQNMWEHTLSNDGMGCTSQDRASAHLGRPSSNWRIRPSARPA